jgi:hypothetical protein
MKLLSQITVLLFLYAGAALTVWSQGEALSGAALDQLLGQIALYPDPLIAEILPASTLPTQIVLADRYVSGGGDVDQIGQQPWDPSVQAVARYPKVLKWMDDNLNWTMQSGLAFLNQQPEVMSSIQRLRATAARLGNLQSSPQQQVVADGSAIEIIPADPQLICVPVYQPDQVYDEDADGWPFPIPLVKQGGQWFFDSAAGKQEILARRIGQDELGTINVCEAYVGGPA